MVKPDLNRIIKEINTRELTAYEIAKHTPLSEDGINKILTGASKNPRTTTLLILHEFLFGKETPEKQKTPPVDARFEDVISEKVVEMLKPFIQERTDDVIRAVMNLHLELARIKNQQAKTHEKVEVIEKRG